MLIRICLFLVIILFSQKVEAQHFRQYDLCDSTEYVLNSDTTIVVSKYNLYTQTESDFQLHYAFDMPFSDYYIRDFDIVAPNFWYTLIGDKTISNPSYLYKSTDHGQNWVIDTSYYSAINNSITNITFDPFDPNYYQSINQVQKIGTDTILLFLGYYGSGIVYSIDGGNEWSHWFANSPAHYFGMLECEQSYYLYQQEGDGFVGRMFPFDKQFLFRNDSLVNFDHLPSGSGHHPPLHLNDLSYVVYYSNLNNCEAFFSLNNYVDSICQLTTTSSSSLQDQSLQIYPNPSDGQFNIQINPAIFSPIEMTVYNYAGQKMFSQVFPNTTTLSDFQSFPLLDAGTYLLVLKNQESVLVRKILVH